MANIGLKRTCPPANMASGLIDRSGLRDERALNTYHYACFSALDDAQVVRNQQGYFWET
jgi:hypothetical protein